MTMLRKNFGEPGGEQKYFMYFSSPGGRARNMTFMVYKYPGKDADRWLFVPAINMVRRIAAQDKSPASLVPISPMRMFQAETLTTIPIL